jgi:hypothetical protein
MELNGTSQTLPNENLRYSGSNLNFCAKLPASRNTLPVDSSMVIAPPIGSVV